jgi:hypothetical protein
MISMLWPGRRKNCIDERVIGCGCGGAERGVLRRRSEYALRKTVGFLASAVARER